MKKYQMWCRKICKRTNTKYDVFIVEFLKSNPSSEKEANKVMEKLLYKAWNTDYDRIWDKETLNFKI